jgi:hypothetical protein
MAYVPISNKQTTGKYVPIGSKPTTTPPAKKRALPAPTEGVPFDATKTGIAVNTVKGLPKAALDVLREIPRGIAGTAAQGTAALLGVPQEKVILQPKTKTAKFIFGDKEINPAKEGAALLDLVPGIKEDTAKKYGPALYAGLTLSDFISVPGKKKAVIESLKTVNNLSGARRLLKDAGIADETIDALKLDSKAVAAKTDEAAEAIIKEATAKQTPLPKVPKATEETPVPTKTVPTTAGKVVPETAGIPTPVRAVADEVPTPVKAIPTPTEKSLSDFVISPKAITTGKVSDVSDVLRVRDGVMNVNVLSRVAHNSLKNTKLGIRPESIAAQTVDVVSGKSPRVVEVRVLDDGRIDIIDGRHLLEAARRNNVKEIKIKDVTKDYFPDGVDTSLFYKKDIAPRTKLIQPEGPQTPDQLIAGARAKYAVQARKPEPALPQLAEKAKVPTTPSGLKILAGELLTPISSRLQRISPALKTALRKFEFRVAQQTQRDSVQVLPLLKATKKLSKEDSVVFDLALKNGDEDVLQAVAKKYGFEDDLNEARLVLDDIYQRAKDVGIDVNYRKNYFPRIVKNPADYVAYWRSQEDWSAIRQMVEDHATKLGKKYTDLSDEEISGIVNNFLRGYGDKVQLATPNFAKGRTIEVIDDELNQFYVPSNEALSTYIIRMNDEIEGRKFFGKQLDTEGKPMAAGDSIGAYVMKQIQDGKLDPRREREVADILKARFSRGKMNGALDAYRHAEYISTMGSPISAITQIGDVAWSIYDNGLYHTAKGMFKGKGRVTKEDLGIEQVTQEFSNQTKLGKALETVFKYTGMEKLDRLGKETLVNAEYSKFSSLAKKNDPEMLNYLSKTFEPEEVPQVMKEFANGEMTENTKLVMFNKLLDFQPVAKSEMPQIYLEHPNGRLFYMLKSFTLKQYDIFRREAVDDIVSGDKAKMAKGMKNLMLLAGSFALANATADEIKDLILGRETPVEDRVVDNIWRLLGATKYDVYKARQDGIGQTVVKKILFPTSLADRAYQDIGNAITGKVYEKGPLKGEPYKIESTQTIPVGGKLYYWWFGRGAQKEEYKAGGTNEATGLPQLPKLPSVGGGALPQLPKLPKIGG